MGMPESPYYLLSKGREAEGIEALARFRGKSHKNVLKEIEEIQVRKLNIISLLIIISRFRIFFFHHH